MYIYMAIIKKKMNELHPAAQAKSAEYEAYRDGVISVLQSAYKVAKPTDEMDEIIRGNYASDFVGTVTWSRALDFPIPGMPDARGLRYIDFTDCTLIRLLMKDGSSISVYELTKSELSLVRDGLQKHLDAAKKTRHQVKL